MPFCLFFRQYCGILLGFPPKYKGVVVHHILFNEASNTHQIAVLVQYSALNEDNIKKHYLDPLAANCNLPDVGAYDLAYEGTKATSKLQKAYLGDLLPILKDMGTKTILVADGNYFKTLTGSKKAEPHYGYVLPCVIKGYEHLNVVLIPNYKGLFYNPMLQQKIDLALSTLSNFLNGTPTDLGSNIIKYEYYPANLSSIQQAISDLHQYPKLTLDLEAFSLKHFSAGLGTCGFSWNEHEGIAFPIDILDSPSFSQKVRVMLREFLETYNGTIIYHNANFDMKLLCYNLWMDGLDDIEGMLEGIEVLTKNFDDTKIITYLATNTTAGNKLSLKDVAHEFAGNWAQEDIKNIRLIPLDKLLTYNLVDCLSTFYVYKKHLPTLVTDNQMELYTDLFKPAVKQILQMELTGMPLDPNMVEVVGAELLDIRETNVDIVRNLQCVKDFTIQMREDAQTSDFANRVDKAKNPSKIQIKPLASFDNILFNPGSNTQLQQLIYLQLGYPVLDKTESGAPSAKGKTIKKLIHMAKTPEHKTLFESLVALSDVSTILDNFISAFRLAVRKSDTDERVYLFGNFNLGGTVSGRLSSSGPNLQNIPSNSVYAKHIKRCFKAPDGWFFVGADFASLEDRISALTTKDPNKIKVYTDGYDGHCLRAYSYFGQHMLDIDPTSVESINSIADLYPDYRQWSKTPTFALTYNGTYIAIMEQTGMTEFESKDIEAKYHVLYKVSDEWVSSKVNQATKDGYVTVAFGLRVRTPILSQTILNSRVTPYEAQKESRTAGNALGQSYGLLNTRAGIEVQRRVLASPYAKMILPIAHIHDAQYFLVKDDINCFEWFNRILVEAMEWQELPEIQHDEVKLGGNLELYYPTWADKCVIPNSASSKEIRTVFHKLLDKQNGKDKKEV